MEITGLMRARFRKKSLPLVLCDINLNTGDGDPPEENLPNRVKLMTPGHLKAIRGFFMPYLKHCQAAAREDLKNTQEVAVL